MHFRHYPRICLQGQALVTKAYVTAKNLHFGTVEWNAIQATEMRMAVFSRRRWPWGSSAKIGAGLGFLAGVPLI
jgi:hypothetical protein